MSERFSVETTKAKEENRIVSALTAITLIKEGRYPDAKVFAESFAEIKNVSPEVLNRKVSWYFVSGGNNCINNKEVATKMLTVANILSNEPSTIDEQQTDQCTTILTELLDAINTKTR